VSDIPGPGGLGKKTPYTREEKKYEDEKYEGLEKEPGKRKVAIAGGHKGAKHN